MGQIDSLMRDDSIEGLTQVKVAQVELAHQLFSDDLPATDIQELLTHINRDIYCLTSAPMEQISLIA